jgi:hypothetical protein
VIRAAIALALALASCGGVTDGPPLDTTSELAWCCVESEYETATVDGCTREIVRYVWTDGDACGALTRWRVGQGCEDARPGVDTRDGPLCP